MIKLVLTSQKIIEERNKLLMAWVADGLELYRAERQQFYKEIRIVLKHTTDGELAEYLLEKLHPKKLIEDLASARGRIQQFNDIAHDKLSSTYDNQND